MGGACSMYGERVLVGKSEGKSLGRARHRWDDNIKGDLHEVGWETLLQSGA